MSDEGERLEAVLIAGPIGAGKTAVATEIGELLAKRDVPNAIVDLDWLAWVHTGPGHDSSIDELIAKNLSLIWPNFRAVGVRRVVLTRANQGREQLEGLRHALEDAHIRVVRLTASPTTITARIRRRDTGSVLEEHLAETIEPTNALDDSPEDLVVLNEGRPVEKVAQEILAELDWA